MAWFKIRLTEEEQKVVNEERTSHPCARVREKMLVIWLLHNGLTREKAAEIAGVARSAVQRYVDAFKNGGLDALRKNNYRRPTSDMESYRDIIYKSLNDHPVRTINEACERIFELTGLRRKPTQVRKFLISLGITYRKCRPIPLPPKKDINEHIDTQQKFIDNELDPLLDQAKAGNGHVFFCDAAHFVMGCFLTCLWSAMSIFLPSSCGRSRYSVLGAWDAINRRLVSVTTTATVNSETVCELLRKIAAMGLTGPITLVMDNARYQHNEMVQNLAKELGIRLLFLPAYSPNLNLIERLWKFVKRKALYGRYYPTFDKFQAGINEVLDGLETTHSKDMKTLMTLKFQTFENVPLLAA